MKDYTFLIDVPFPMQFPRQASVFQYQIHWFLESVGHVEMNIFFEIAPSEEIRPCQIRGSWRTVYAGTQVIFPQKICP